MPPKARRVARNIYFYRVNVGHDGGGAPTTFDPTPMLAAFRTLPFTMGGRYFPQGDHLLCAWTLATRSPHSIRFANIRRVDLPAVELAGRLAPLRIHPNAGLAESVHVVFFRHNIVGSEFNFHGPRLTRLGDYIRAKVPGSYPALEFEPLLRPDISQQLHRLSNVRMFQIKIRRSFVEVVRQSHRDLGNALAAALSAGGAEEVEVILTPKAYARSGGISDRLLRTARALLRRADINQEARKLVIEGFDPQLERVQQIDLLNNQLVSRQAIATETDRTRALSSDSTLEAIVSAHGELRAELEEASSLLL